MKKVLLVDDDPDVLFVTEILLTRNGFLVESLPDLSKVKQKIHQFEPGLLILDINLQDGDGRSICREIKSNQDTKDLPVLLFSAGYNYQHDLIECMADGFIEKPFEPQQLVNKAKVFF